MVFCDFHVEAGGGESKENAFIAVGGDEDTETVVQIMSRSAKSKNDEVRIRNCTKKDIEFWSGGLERAKFTRAGTLTQRGLGSPVRDSRLLNIQARWKSDRKVRGSFFTDARSIINGPNHILYAYKEKSGLVLLNGSQFSEKFRYMDNSDNPFASRWDTMKNPDSHKVTAIIKCPIVQYIHTTFDVPMGSTYEHKYKHHFGWEKTSTEESTMTIKNTAELSSQFKYGDIFEFNGKLTRDEEHGFKSIDTDTVKVYKEEEHLTNYNNKGNSNHGYGAKTWRFTHFKAHVTVLGNKIDLPYDRIYEESEDRPADLGEYEVEIIKYEL
mmetsp:Transcript_19263/g.21827  ORF Transcript_19263/g.21827 Transcript_19263/m.21827 type:complete len:325 (-) Transcript_19263:269-1243(-)